MRGMTGPADGQTLITMTYDLKSAEACYMYTCACSLLHVHVHLLKMPGLQILPFLRDLLCWGSE